MPHADDVERSHADDLIRAFEATSASRRELDIRAFLPSPDNPLYGPVLCELVRVDLENGWARGQPRPLAEYQALYPELFGNRESVEAVVFEEYRLRRQAGEDVNPAEYERRYGVNVASWPCSLEEGSCDLAQTPPAALARGAEANAQFGSALGTDRTAPSTGWSQGNAGAGDTRDTRPATDQQDRLEHGEPHHEVRSAHSAVGDWLEIAATAMPKAGDEFLGFRLIAELGSGTFGRVFLSRQAELADRLAVVKIAPRQIGESRMLAQLQHPHIIPIHSVHETSNLQVVCMPFLGTTTLDHVLRDLRTLPALPVGGKYLLDRIEAEGRKLVAMTAGAVAEPAGFTDGAFGARLARMSYVNAILALAARLADALAHAHARGIVHQDLKPANILLAHDGSPVLLDFNLADDRDLRRSARTALLGGSLPYMAPEQLRAFHDGTGRGDERSDLYSLGIIVFELLTGRELIEPGYNTLSELLERMAFLRSRPTSVRQWNAQVSPATEAIVHRCLEPEPSKRYQSARELSEDLGCQLQHLPLRHTPEPSIRERAVKCIRRHPRLTVAAGASIAATSFGLVLTGGLQARINGLLESTAAREAEHARMKAVVAARDLRDDLHSLEFLLGSTVLGAESEQRAELISVAAKALDRHQVLQSLDWKTGPLVSALDQDQRKRVAEDMGELLLLVAGAQALQGRLELALDSNGRAINCYASASVPRALWEQRAEFSRSVGNAVEAERLAALAGRAPARSPRDRYLLLLKEYEKRGRLRADLPALRDSTRQQRDNFSVWLILGNSYAELGERRDAIECFDMAAALRPDSYWPALCRGLVYLELRNYRDSRADFGEVMRLKPDLREAYYNRALASYYLDDHAAAYADLTHLLDEPDPPIRTYFLRRVRQARRSRRCRA